MVNEAFFAVYDIPRPERRKRRRHVNEYNKNESKDAHYQDNYGL